MEAVTQFKQGDAVIVASSRSNGTGRVERINHQLALVSWERWASRTVLLSELSRPESVS